MELIFKTDLHGVDWNEMKAAVSADDFDNGRSAHQLQQSFANSYASVIAYGDGRIVGTSRALSDGICNAYVVDVWTHSAFRHCGIARAMMDLLLARLNGQHVYLFTDGAAPFYEKLGFQREGIGMGRVVGRWLTPGS